MTLFSLLNVSSSRDVEQFRDVGIDLVRWLQFFFGIQLCVVHFHFEDLPFKKNIRCHGFAAIWCTSVRRRLPLRVVRCDTEMWLILSSQITNHKLDVC